ncbi:PIN domain-containing protein [Sphingomonas sp. ID1715]|nr:MULTISPECIES: PIN domain-containing protein [Alphaproteobacteria]MDZ5450442.1 PIN domain-containing protein [Labrys sp. ZIDIC5]NNM75298.1 PIN domain-containing protein [Sphingomonas sp. ID1715]
MASRPPIAVYDACVLYPFHLRNVLIQCAFDGLVAARWTDDIHAEWIRNLAANSPGTPVARFETTRDMMKAVLPDANVANHRSLIPSLSLPDPDDRHVLAAAIAGGAETIVTWNLKDFPAPQIAPHGIAAVSPDAFLSALHRAYPKALLSSIARARENLRRTTPSVTEFVDALERHGLVAFTSILRRHAARLR